MRGSSECVASLCTALRFENAFASEALQYFADYGSWQVDLLREFARVLRLGGFVRILREMREQHDAVVGDFAESEHGVTRGSRVVAALRWGMGGLRGQNLWPPKTSNYIGRNRYCKYRTKSVQNCRWRTNASNNSML